MYIYKYCEKNVKANSSRMYKITIQLKSETQVLRNFSLNNAWPNCAQRLKAVE